MAEKMSGWRKAGMIAGLGCLSIIGVIVVGVIAAVFWAKATLSNLGDTSPTPVDTRITLPAPATGLAAISHLTLDLREGRFTIRPTAPGGDVQVQGTFAPGLYELIQDQSTDPATGATRTTIRFLSKAPAWARIFGGLGDSDDRPELTVLIPRGAPIDLSLQVSMGESDIDLGGLTLREVDLDVSMGEHRITFQEPVAEEGVRRLRIDASMGNVSVAQLGNARAASINTAGSMGNLTADLGGAWPAGATADLTFAQSMGELTLRVPSDVHLESDVEQPKDPKAPTLRLRVSTSMGNSRVIRY